MLVDDLLKADKVSASSHHTNSAIVIVLWFGREVKSREGKRFEKWGLFGKARPGLVGFSRVFDFGVQVGAGNQFEKKLCPSLDIGGVVEFYVSPRWMARFDFGDTLIHYAGAAIVEFHSSPRTTTR